jgi:hypothetical protein
MNTSKSSESKLTTEAVQPSREPIRKLRAWTEADRERLELSKQEVKAGLEASNRLEAARMERWNARTQHKG